MAVILREKIFKTNWYVWFLKTDMGIDFDIVYQKTWGCGLGFEAANAVLAYGIE